jgi:hypothetical protein
MATDIISAIAERLRRQPDRSQGCLNVSADRTDNLARRDSHLGSRYRSRSNTFYSINSRPSLVFHGAEHGAEACRRDAELRQYGEYSDGGDQVARETTGEALQHRVEMRR